MRNKASVLIVDDDKEMTETLSDILTELGHHVEVANDGLKAIEKVKAQPFDVILMDIRMPGINGVETYKEVKKNQPGAAVMMMTAYAVQDLVAEALEEGAYGVMYKPIDITRAIKLIESVKKSILILFVDVDLPTCETLINLLKKKRYHIAKVSSGEEAIKVVQKRNIDIVFIEVKMPVMNGLETYLALRKIRPNIKAIMMTRYRLEVQDLIDESLKESAYACIYKPIDVDGTLKLVEGILAKKTKTEVLKMQVG